MFLVSSLSSLDVRHSRTWSEVSLLIVIAETRLNLASQFPETKILSSLARLGSSLILDQVNWCPPRGKSINSRSLIRLLNSYLSRVAVASFPFFGEMNKIEIPLWPVESFHPLISLNSSQKAPRFSVWFGPYTAVTICVQLFVLCLTTTNNE